MDNINKTLNSDQTEAAKEILQFLFSKNKELIISGSAGTGKTFLMQYIIKDLLDSYKTMCKTMSIEYTDYTIYLTATTNKASKVLGENIDKDTCTIYSLLNLTVRNNYSNGKQILIKNNNNNANKKPFMNSLIFIDECSMIDSNLYKHIYDDLLAKDNNNKIIYIGDVNQLPPVDEAISPVFSKDIPTVYLTEQMRNNAIPNLMKLSEQFKQTVQNGIFNPIKADSKNIIHLSGKDFSKKIEEYFIKNTTDSKILAYTNDYVNKYNTYIRNSLHYPKNFIENEIVIVNTPYLLTTTNGKLSLYAELEMRIVEVLPKTKLEYGSYSLECFTYLSDQTGKTQLHSPVNIDEYYSLLKTISKKKDWDSYFYFKDNIIDIRPSYASTVHKSQGSTYDNVFIDLNDIGKHWKNNEVARMLYVAFTRAKYNIFLRGTLPLKYGGDVIT